MLFNLSTAISKIKQVLVANDVLLNFANLAKFFYTYRLEKLNTKKSGSENKDGQTRDNTLQHRRSQTKFLTFFWNSNKKTNNKVTKYIRRLIECTGEVDRRSRHLGERKNHEFLNGKT